MSASVALSLSPTSTRGHSSGPSARAWDWRGAGTSRASPTDPISSGPTGAPLPRLPDMQFASWLPTITTACIVVGMAFVADSSIRRHEASIKELNDKVQDLEQDMAVLKDW